MNLEDYASKKDVENMRIRQILYDYPLVPNTRSTKAMQSFSNKNAQIYEIVFPYMRRAILSMKGISPEIKEDCVSECFFWLIRAIPGYLSAPNPNFINYIIRSMKNFCIRYNKHNKHSYFSRTETVIPFQTDEYDLADVVGQNDKDPFENEAFQIKIECRFRGNDLLFIKQCLKSLALYEGSGIVFQGRTAREKFLVKWLQIKLKEVLDEYEQDNRISIKKIFRTA